MGVYYYGDYLAHHGVMGMHWGIRRYQPYSVKPRGSGKGGKFVGGKGTSESASGGQAKPSAFSKIKKKVDERRDKRETAQAKRDAREKAMYDYLHETRSSSDRRTALSDAMYATRNKYRVDDRVQRRMKKDSYKQKFEKYSNNISEKSNKRLAESTLRVTRPVRKAQYAVLRGLVIMNAVTLAQSMGGQTSSKTSMVNKGKKMLDKLESRRAMKDARNKAAFDYLQANRTSKNIRRAMKDARYATKNKLRTDDRIQKRMKKDSYREKYNEYSKSITQDDARKLAKSKLRAHRAMRVVRGAAAAYAFNPFVRAAVNKAVSRATRGVVNTSKYVNKARTNRYNRKHWSQSRALPGPRGKIIDNVKYTIYDID